LNINDNVTTILLSDKYSIIYKRWIIYKQ